MNIRLHRDRATMPGHIGSWFGVVLAVAGIH